LKKLQFLFFPKMNKKLRLRLHHKQKNMLVSIFNNKTFEDLANEVQTRFQIAATGFLVDTFHIFHLDEIGDIIDNPRTVLIQVLTKDATDIIEANKVGKYYDTQQEKQHNSQTAAVDDIKQVKAMLHDYATKESQAVLSSKIKGLEMEVEGLKAVVAKLSEALKSRSRRTNSFYNVVNTSSPYSGYSTETPNPEEERGGYDNIDNRDIVPIDIEIGDEADEKVSSPMSGLSRLSVEKKVATPEEPEERSRAKSRVKGDEGFVDADLSSKEQKRVNRMKLALEDKVELHGAREGIIRYIGETDFSNGVIYGLELVGGTLGDNSGVVDGKRYFETKEKRGVFIKGSEIRRKCRKPPPKESVNSVYRKRLIRIYEEFNESKLKSVDSFLEKNKGKEHAFYVKVCNKYFVKPAGKYEV